MIKIVLLVLIVAVTGAHSKEICEDISCSSWGYRYATCDVPNGHKVTKVSLKQQVSKTNCQHGRKYGMKENKIWVDNGCRGTFHVCYQKEEETGDPVSVIDIPSNIFVGEYECHKYDGTKHKNNWHYVEITFNPEDDSYQWKNHAGVAWTLYPMNENTLRVGRDCPYYKDGHTTARFEREGVYGPWGELYQRKLRTIPLENTDPLDSVLPYKINEIAVTWGQNNSANKRLLPENRLSFYCDNIHYDTISVSFVDIMNAVKYGDPMPHLHLSGHCTEYFDGYPNILQCHHIGEEIKDCQTKGIKIILEIRGFDSTYNNTEFKNAGNAALATMIWNMFLGGAASFRPFGDVILDGINIQLEKRNSMNYAEFLKSIKSFMSADKEHKYLLSASVEKNTLEVEFDSELNQVFSKMDQLYLKGFSQLHQKQDFEKSLRPWFLFAQRIRKISGNAPNIFIGLQGQGTENYIPPDHLDIMERIVYNRNFGGVMLWDAGADSSQKIDGKYYSWYITEILYKPRITVCPFPGGFRQSLGVEGLVCIVAVLLAVIAIIKFAHMKYKSLKKLKQVGDKLETPSDGAIEKVKMNEEKVKPKGGGDVKV